MPRRISLNMIDVKEPCSADWSAMTGTEQVKYCAHCKKSVHNLSAMSLSDAERLVCEAARALCVRFERLHDGTIRTLDYQQVSQSRLGWKAWVGVGLVTSVLAVIGQRWWERSRQPPVLIYAGMMSINVSSQGEVQVISDITPEVFICPPVGTIAEETLHPSSSESVNEP